jgi:hypothetical protein
LLDRADGEKGGRDLGDGRRAHRFVLGVAAYELGDVEIPSIELSYINPRGEVRSAHTEPIALHVRPLVAEDEAHPEVQPNRPPRSAMVEDKRMLAIARWTGIALGGALLIGLCAFLTVRALRKRTVETALVVPAVIKRPADEVAMDKLRALRERGNFAADGYRPFFFAVAEIVREYLGARYGFDSLELTTTELLDQLNQRAAHLTRPDGEVVKFLSDTDLVKFARTGSTDAAAVAALDGAQAIVLSTAMKISEAVNG